MSKGLGPTILLVYSDGLGYGTGHRVRMEKLAQALPGANAVLHKRVSLAALKDEVNKCQPSVVVFDGRENPVAMTRFVYQKGIAVLVFDSTGADRDWADFVVEGLPGLEERPGRANLEGLSWLPPVSWARHGEGKGVVAYGGGLYDISESSLWFSSLMDGALHLEPPQATALESLTLVVAPGLPVSQTEGFQQKAFELGFKRVEVVTGLPHFEFSKLLANCAIFYSYFGLGAFEALAAGVPLRLLSPRPVHQQLSEKHLGAFHLGLAGDTLRRPEPGVVKVGKDPQTFAELGKNWALWPGVLAALAAHKRPNRCPICSSPQILRVSRRAVGSLWNCEHCGVSFLEEMIPTEMFGQGLPPHAHGDYGQAYFTTEYQRAYGKTYAEDRPALYRLADQRLDQLQKLGATGKILDVGSAMGFFLDRARSRGFATHGIEMSPWAVAQGQIEHQVTAGSVMEVAPQGPFDVITLWYVVEHFREIRELLARLDGWLAPGGILAFSTPHGHGLSGRWLSAGFLASSPDDHYYIYTTKSLKKLVKPLGYQLRCHLDSGVHFARFQKAFPLLGNLVPEKIFRLLARVFHWGDTGEWYFRKNL